MLVVNLNSVIINEVKPAPRVSIAFLLGASDGESGALCVPEQFFCKREFILSYVAGFEAAAGKTLLSSQAKRIYKVAS